MYNEIGHLKQRKELKRGTVEQRDTNLKSYYRYFAEVGQRVYETRRKNSKKPYKLAKASKFLSYAKEQILKHHMAPDTICGKAKKEGGFSTIVSTKTLYNYIDFGLLPIKNIDLPLRVSYKKKARKCRTRRRVLGESISNRPSIINERKEFGHWEIDTVIGKQTKSCVLLTLDERLTRQRFIVKIPSKSAEAVELGIKKIWDKFGTKSSKIFRSITSDNGSEFASLANVLPDTAVYYAHPYASFERGTNERQNGLLLRFFPKGTSFDNVSEEAIDTVEHWINHLPRRIFNYASSNDLFSYYLSQL